MFDTPQDSKDLVSKPDVKAEPAMSALGKPVSASRRTLFRGSGVGKIMPIPHRENNKHYSVRKQSNTTQSLLPVLESLRWRAEPAKTALAVKQSDAAKTAATAIITLLRIQ